MGINDFINALKKNPDTIKRTTRSNPYVIQIGFDWGTSYSKCIYRDLGKNRAFVYTFESNGREEFLISSSILYKDDKLYLNKSNEQYPNYGIWNIKMALSDICNKLYSSYSLNQFKKFTLIQHNEYSLKLFIKACSIFYLSKILQQIRTKIISTYHDFGQHPGDDMYVTMAIPVSDISNTYTKSIFKEVLGKAWYLACHKDLLGNLIARKTMEDIIQKNYKTDDLVFNVYPEVSANVQALCNSPYASINDTRIYIFTDIGSGTVDQCCFTFFSPKKIKERK